MKRHLLFALSFVACQSSMAQTVLTGALTPQSIPAAISTPFSGITTVDQLNARLDAAGDMVIKDATLSVPQGSGEVFWALDELTLQSSTITTNGADLKIICRKLNAINPSIFSFNPIPTAATSGMHGLDGRNGGNVTVYILNHYQGKLGLGLAGENGGKGVNGGDGRNGGNGKSSRDRHGFCRRCAKGGEPGGNGTNGGNGGRGGDGGSITVHVLKNPAAFPIQNVIFGALGGEAGSAGRAGAAGIGGKGGKNHGPCKISCAKPASRARSGKAGKAGVAGVAGTNGKKEVRLFNITDLLQTQTVVKEQ